MKKILLVIAIFAVARVNAQVVNGDFENWAIDTAHFAGFSGVVPAATFPYSDPVGWTSINGVTGAPGLGSLFLVTESNTAYTNNHSIQLVTDTLATVTITGLGAKQLVVPGMILNGIFNESAILSVNSVLQGGTVTPASVPGSGQPFTQRLADFTGWYQYTPVLDTFTHTLDSCVMWATLRKGSLVVANARFTSTTATTDWTSFSAPFVYLNCEVPDTLSILLSSSIPKFASILSAQTDLVPGSVLLVDDLAYDTLASSVDLLFAVNDASTATTHTPDTIAVLTNDCSLSSPMTVTIATQPANGTAVVLSNGDIVYTSNAGFAGRDSLKYMDTDPATTTGTAWVYINVNFGTGISEANEVKMNMFPVPASNQLHIQFENKGRTTAHIYDVVGNLVQVATLTQNDNNISVAGLANGVYNIQLADESNTIIARGKFVVSR